MNFNTFRLFFQPFCWLDLLLAFERHNIKAGKAITHELYQGRALEQGASWVAHACPYLLKAGSDFIEPKSKKEWTKYLTHEERWKHKA